MSLIQVSIPLRYAGWSLRFPQLHSRCYHGARSNKLSGSKMENVYESVHEVREHCRDRKLEGCLIQRADLSVLSFEEYLLDRVSFKSVNLGDVSFLKSMLHAVSFNSAGLRGAVLGASHIRGTNFFNSDASHRGQIFKGTSDSF